MDKPTKIVIGVFGPLIILWIVFLQPAINRWVYRGTRARSDCYSRLIILNSAIVEYATKHDGQLPPADRWCDEIMPYIRNNRKDIENPFHCPLDLSKDKRNSSYAMNASLSNGVLSQLPKDTVLLFESKPGWNRSGGPADMSFENHHYWEDAVRCGILFADGKAWCIDKNKPPSLRWEP
jgi:hypothetical protein